MPELSERDMIRLATCHVDLQTIVIKVAERIPLMVVCGFRDKEKQDKAYSGGFTQVKWPNSLHNRERSMAVDLCPTNPVDWNDIDRFRVVASYMWAEGLKNNIGLKWGGSFSFGDYGHFELK